MKSLLPVCFLCLPFFLLAQQTLTCEDEFLLTGTAVLQGECIRLTSNTTSQLGCAWYADEIDFSMPFTHTMVANFGTTDGNGADGICLVYQSNNSSTCGISGEGIGAQSIPNSFIVEFDTWQNGNLGDPFNDHVAININGDFTNTINGPFELGNIEDGNDHDIEFSWDPAGNNYEVYFDGALVLSGSFDIINNCFGGDNLAFWGYTSSTGGASNEHLICPGLPPEVVADAGSSLEIPCLGAEIELDGTNSDQGPDFSYEWTTNDGNIVSGELTLTPTIDEPGTYTLTVFNNATLCENESEVTITIGEIEADVGIPPFLDCIPGEVTLDGSGSTSGNNITYVWSTNDGNIISTNGEFATVDEVGEYTLTVIYDDGFGVCMEEVTVQVEEDPNVPIAFGEDAILGCDPPAIELSGVGSSEGSEYSYEWTTFSGNIINGENSLFPLVDEAGEYVLTVTNQFTGCTDEFAVFVTGSNVVPEAIAFADEDLPCNGGAVLVEGNFSSNGPNFIYEWSTTNGNIISDESEANIFVDQAGEYLLIVTNTDNNCTAEAIVTVEELTSTTNISILPPGQLTCTSNSVILDATPTTPASGLDYSWSTTNGMLIGNTDEVTATANAVGDYLLTTTEIATGCVSTSIVSVSADLTEPTAFAEDEILTCDPPIIELSGVGSSEGNDFSYEWSTVDGNIINGENSLFPLVDEAGEYLLTVTNDLTGCINDVTIFVTGSNVAAEAIAFADEDIPCTGGSVLVEGNFSSNGPNFIYEWSTTNGNIVSDEMDADIFVDQPGDYLLIVTNTDNDCTNEAMVTVGEVVSTANVSILNPSQITCSAASVLLDATPTTPATGLTYTWSTSNGNLLGDTDGITATAGAAGDYLLTVEETVTGCISTMMINVSSDLVDPIAEAGTATPFGCDDVSLQLNGSGSTAIGVTYAWSTTNGVILSGGAGLMPNVGASGTYELLVTNATNGCTATDVVVVPGDDDTPVVQIALTDTLDCTTNSLVLDALGSSDGSDGNSYSLNWSTPDGQFVSGENGLQPAVSAAGTYTLSIVNDSNGCENSLSVSVVQDTIHPQAIINTPGVFICDQTSLDLNAENSSQGNNFSYEWSTINGQILNGNNSLSPAVGIAGTYELLVTNTANNCQSSAATVVTADLVAPELSIATADTLDCLTTSVNVQSSLTNPVTNTSYSWSTPDGNFVGDNTAAQSNVDAPGTYQLIVINTDNNCSDTASVMIIQNIINPIADAGNDGIINCTILSQDLGGNTTSTGNEFTYEWTSPNATINSNNTLSALMATNPGTYILEVTNQNNNCTAIDTTILTQDITPPVALVNTPPLLTCTDSLSLLDGSGSGGAPNLMFNWSTPDGSLAGSNTTAQTNAGQEGTYQLIVTNPNNGCADTTFATVMQDANFPTANIATPAVLDCGLNAFELAGTANSVSGSLAFNWSTGNGNILANENTLNPTIDAPGTYTLTVEDLANNCTAQASTLIVLDTIAPIAAAGTSAPFGCNDTEIQLDASSMTSSDASYSWTTDDGQVIAGENTLMPVISTAGTYLLTVVSNQNDCVATDAIIVTSDLTLPLVNLTVSDTLDCDITQLNIDASTSSSGTNFITNWSTTNGNFLAGTDGLEPTINSAGTYELSITNTENGCSDNAIITVLQDTIAPIAAIAFPDTLNCLLTSQVLSGSNSSQGTSITFEWSTSNGQIDSAPELDNISVSTPGAYQLLVTNTDNGCNTTTSTTVALDDVAPMAEAGMVMELNCDTEELQLQGGDSSAGNDITYLWSTIAGNILSGETSINPSINAAGEYSLVVTNTNNHCSSSDVVMVNIDTVAPQPIIAMPAILTCTDTLVSLDATTSVGNSALSFTWSNSEDQAILDANAAIASVGQEGNYMLLVESDLNGCTATATVTVLANQVDPLALIATSDTLDCVTPNVTLDATNSSGGNLAFEWSSMDGNAIENPTTPTPIITVEGVYDLLVTDQENGCFAQAAIEVIDDSDSPEVSIDSPAILTCNLTEQSLITVNSNTGNAPTYNWTTPDGNIVANGNTPSPTINQGGIYTLMVTNNENGCVGQDEVLVLIDQEDPVISILPYEQLDCATSTINIDAGISTGTNTLDFVWTTSNGSILGENNGELIEVNSPGDYQLILNDIVNGCADTLLTTVTQDTIAPIAIITMPGQLDCMDESIILDAQASSNGPNFQVDWSTVGGQFDTGTSSLTPEVSQPGNYQLVIFNTQNSCSDTAQVIVTQDDELPLIIFAQADTLNCAVGEITLDANASSTGDPFVYTWTTTDGQIIAGANTLMPTVGEPGNYILTIENEDNNCENSATLIVAQDIVPPLANAGADFELDCGIDFTNLDGTASSQGTIYTYQWTPLSGQMIMNETSLMPQISMTGSYQLTVINTVNACLTTDEVTVTQDIPVASIDHINPLCFGETGNISFSSVIGGQPPYLYSINGGQTYVQDNFFLDLPAGQYESVVEDSNGCSYSESINVVQPDSVQVVILEPEVEINYGDSILVQVQSNYNTEELTTISWDNTGSLNCSDCLEPIAQPTETSLFRLVVATENGCRDEALLRILVRRDFPVYIPNVFSPNGEGDNDVFYIFAKEGSVNVIHNFAIYDRWGDEIFYVQNALPNDPRFGWDGKYRGQVPNSAVFVYFAEIEMADGRIEIFKGDVVLMR